MKRLAICATTAVHAMGECSREQQRATQRTGEAHTQAHTGTHTHTRARAQRSTLWFHPNLCCECTLALAFHALLQFLAPFDAVARILDQTLQELVGPTHSSRSGTAEKRKQRQGRKAAAVMVKVMTANVTSCVIS